MFRRASTSSGLCSAVAMQMCSYTVTGKEIQTLRYRTEAPMTDCKKALVASEGNMDEAVVWLQKHGAAKANKKGDRQTDHGTVLAAISNAGKGAAIVQVCSETDFASRNDRYLDFTSIVQQKTIEFLETEKHGLSEEYGLTTEEHQARTDAMLQALQNTTEDARKQAVAVLGENITVKKVFAMPNLTSDQAKAVLQVPRNNSEPVIPHSNFFGFYCHNAPSQQHKYVGSMAAIVQLQPRNEDGKGLPRAKEEGDESSRVLIPVSELAQHCVANVFNDSPITQSKVLGTEETAGQWLKRHGVKLQRAMVVQMGKEPVIHTISAPFEGKPPAAAASADSDAPKKEE